MPARKGVAKKTPKWFDRLPKGRFIDAWECARGLWEVAEQFRLTPRQASWYASVLRKRGHRLREFERGGGHASLPPAGFTRETWRERVDAMSGAMLWKERLEQYIDSYRVHITPFEWECATHVADMTQWIAEGLDRYYPTATNVMYWVRDECRHLWKMYPVAELADYEAALSRLHSIGLVHKYREDDKRTKIYRYSYAGHIRIPHPKELRKYNGPASDMPYLDELVMVVRGTPLTGSVAA